MQSSEHDSHSMRGPLREDMGADTDVARVVRARSSGLPANTLPRSNGDRRGSIMVIEHDLATRETLALMLRDDGYDVTVAGDGRGATSLLSHMTPDLVVMVNAPLLNQVFHDELAPIRNI